MNRFSKLNIRWIDAVVFLIATALFYYVFMNVPNDIRAHLRILSTSIEHGMFPVPPLYYLTVYIFSGFLFKFQVTAGVAFLILGASVAAKFNLTRHLLLKETIHGNFQHFFTVSSLFLLVCMSIYSGGNLYLGEPSPNVWHNSTIIFLMPFAVGLFYTAHLIYKRELTRKLIVLYYVLIIVNALAKPSFLFVFSIIPVVYFFYKGFDRKLNVFLGGSVLAVLIVILEFSYLYLLDFDPYTFSEVKEKNDIIIAPFDAWSHFSPNIILSLLSSIVFPLGVVISKPSILKGNFLLVLSWIQFFIAIVIFSLFTESGSRRYDLNLAWQIIPSLYLLFAVSLINVFNHFSVPTKEQSSLNTKGKVLYALFVIHFLSGVYYMYQLIVNFDYT